MLEVQSVRAHPATGRCGKRDSPPNTPPNSATYRLHGHKSLVVLCAPLPLKQTGEKANEEKQSKKQSKSAVPLLGYGHDRIDVSLCFEEHRQKDVWKRQKEGKDKTKDNLAGMPPIISCVPVAIYDSTAYAIASACSETEDHSPTEQIPSNCYWTSQRCCHLIIHFIVPPVQKFDFTLYPSKPLFCS